MKSKLEEKKLEFAKDFSENMRGHCSCQSDAELCFDAGVSAYKEMLEGVGVEKADKFWIKIGDGVPDEVWTTCKPSGESVEVIEALPVLAKLQQQAEKIEKLKNVKATTDDINLKLSEINVELNKKITELESRLKEAESVIKTIATRGQGNGGAVVTTAETLRLIARQYMEKVK
jgi:hypothetical protein